MNDPTFPVIADSVTKRFHQGTTNVEAIRNVSIHVAVGDFVAIMGASGSGKSTLLHVLAGLTRPSEGSVRIEGNDLSSMSDGKLTKFRRHKIGLVFQAFNLIPSLSAYDNIALPLLSEGRQTDLATRVQNLSERLGISPRLHHRPDALSGGEQQRVAIARALIADPAVVLADEPTGSLDSVSGQEICRLLKELCEEQQRTIVMVTHEPAVAQWAQRVVVMRDGEILTTFPTSDFPTTQSLASHYQECVKMAAVI